MNTHYARASNGAAGTPHDFDFLMGVVELRQYTLHPGQRDALIELFDREFVETQESVGMTVMGQFRDLGDPNRFVWLRGFPDMDRRVTGLTAFYDGPVWKAHRDAANATMIDSDNVLLLRPAWPGAGVSMAGRARDRPNEPPSGGVVDVTIFYLTAPPGRELLEFCRGPMTSVLSQAGAEVLGWYITEPSANNFPRLPVREGEHVLVGVATFSNANDVDALAQPHGHWARQVEPTLSHWLARPAESHRLVPTHRSALWA